MSSRTVDAATPPHEGDAGNVHDRDHSTGHEGKVVRRAEARRHHDRLVPGIPAEGSRQAARTYTGGGPRLITMCCRGSPVAACGSVDGAAERARPGRGPSRKSRTQCAYECHGRPQCAQPGRGRELPAALGREPRQPEERDLAAAQQPAGGEGGEKVPQEHREAGQPGHQRVQDRRTGRGGGVRGGCRAGREVRVPLGDGRGVQARRGHDAVGLAGCSAAPVPRRTRARRRSGSASRHRFPPVRQLCAARVRRGRAGRPARPRGPR